jgi:hypothetical protein
MADERETPRRKVLDRWIASRSWGVSASLMPLVANSAAYAQAPVVAIAADAFLMRWLNAFCEPGSIPLSAQAMPRKASSPGYCRREAKASHPTVGRCRRTPRSLVPPFPKTLYDVAQALSWVAGHKPTVEDQIKWKDQIHQLIAELKQGK